IAAAESREIEPAVVLTKADLGSGEGLFERYRSAGFPVFIISNAGAAIRPNHPENGLQALKEYTRGKISAFAGNSGVGKSSLLNLLLPELDLKTGEISLKLGRGRHTTRHAELFALPGGGYVADTAGFSTADFAEMRNVEDENMACRDDRPRSPANGDRPRSSPKKSPAYESGAAKQETLQFCFREFEPFLGKCKYTSCAHIKEQGCAVKAAVLRGEIHPGRYENYVRMWEEVQ
ncbi:MAG: ribosome small subunit-dependent GTPase A, partial [Oscillospiraceae bacterium]|nr:ribosome small subunit-dependent GTPase A [Oscillospiraceae bacterium]